uniref:Translocon-associated protein subunit gamma n=1 Tax=Cyanistes caeruleus TaxID=156563 RepID=A0A8C0V8Y0_CYACU
MQPAQAIGTMPVPHWQVFPTAVHPQTSAGCHHELQRERQQQWRAGHSALLPRLGTQGWLQKPKTRQERSAEGAGGLYWRIWHMDLVQSAVLYSVMTLISTYLVAFAYKNVKFVLKHKVAQKREDAVSKEVTRKLSEADNRKMSRKEKDERILWKKNEVADYEATTFSIFYNNTLFLVLVIIASFFVLKNFNPTVNYILSISASSGLIALLSTGSK